MVKVYCSNCNSNDVKLDGTEKYLICNKCGDKQYVRDLEIGFKEDSGRETTMIKIEQEPMFREYKRCVSCKENKDSIEYFNFDGNIIRICKECRIKLIELLKSTI